jgi:TPR repeat protein
MPTEDGIALLGMNDADPTLILRRVAEARQLSDPDERAARLYFLGRGLLDCNDPATSGDAIEVLGEAMQLGSPHAALDLGVQFLREAESPQEVQVGLQLLQRAAKAGLAEAATLLRELRRWPDPSKPQG